MATVILLLAFCVYTEVVKRIKTKYTNALESIGEIISVILGIALGNPWVPIVTYAFVRVQKLFVKLVLLIVLLVAIPLRHEQIVIPDTTQYSTSIQELDQLLDHMKSDKE